MAIIFDFVIIYCSLADLWPEAAFLQLRLTSRWLLLTMQISSQIPDDFKGYKLDSFFIPKQIESYLDSIIIPRGLIDDR